MPNDPTEDQVVFGLSRAGLPPDRFRGPDQEPDWLNDYGGDALRDAYLAGWRDARED